MSQGVWSPMSKRYSRYLTIFHSPEADVNLTSLPPGNWIQSGTLRYNFSHPKSSFSWSVSVAVVWAGTAQDVIANLPHFLWFKIWLNCQWDLFRLTMADDVRARKRLNSNTSILSLLWLHKSFHTDKHSYIRAVIWCTHSSQDSVWKDSHQLQMLYLFNMSWQWPEKVLQKVPCIYSLYVGSRRVFTAIWKLIHMSDE